MSEQKTLGQYRVGTSFNPSNNPQVDRIKSMSADLIDEVNRLNDSGEGEIRRLKDEAMTLIETAAMYAVKAATKESSSVVMD